LLLLDIRYQSKERGERGKRKVRILLLVGIYTISVGNVHAVQKHCNLSQIYKYLFFACSLLKKNHIFVFSSAYDYPIIFLVPMFYLVRID